MNVKLAVRIGLPVVTRTGRDRLAIVVAVGQKSANGHRHEIGIAQFTHAIQLSPHAAPKIVSGLNTKCVFCILAQGRQPIAGIGISRAREVTRLLFESVRKQTEHLTVPANLGRFEQAAQWTKKRWPQFNGFNGSDQRLASHIVVDVVQSV